jgi:hypothetical protein
LRWGWLRPSWLRFSRRGASRASPSMSALRQNL